MEGNFEVIFVLITLLVMLAVLVADLMRPGLVMFSVCVLFVCTGILSPEELVAGFSNKGMITVALLFLVSEGIRRSDALGHMISHILPVRKGRKPTVMKGYSKLMPTIAGISAFLNNTPIVVIFIPIVKEWAAKAGLPVKKFLIPISYAAILGGMCTLIGTSTNLVVHGMMLEAGYEGFSIFELGKVGGFIAVAGILYIILFGNRLLPSDRTPEETAAAGASKDTRQIEAVIGPRFKGINRQYGSLDFRKRYGARLIDVRRNGKSLLGTAEDPVYKEGDTLLIEADDSFFNNWGDSSEFLMLSNGRPHRLPCPKWKKWVSVSLLALMIAGATFGQMPKIRELVPGISLDMFFWVCIVTVIMAILNLFPAKRYTKFISWDILVTIASALAISKAMTNSGLADMIAGKLTSNISGNVSPMIVLASLYIVTNIITELITNNAAAAFAFPIALSAASQLGVDPMPFFVAICMAASASFSTPIGYQTNMIAQGIGNYRFRDFTRFGFPLNLIAFTLSMILIPVFWKF